MVCSLYACMERDMSSGWMPVVGYEAFYEVSYAGEVRSLPRRVGAKFGATRVRGAKPLSQFVNDDGYYRVRLTDSEGNKKFRMVHHLVAEAFIGKRPLGLLVLHRDDDKAHNEYCNLYYGTHRDNAEDSIRNGKYRSGISLGEKHGLSKLKERDMFVIFELIDGGVSLRQIGFRLGVADSIVGDVIKGKNWGWFTGMGAV
jgi:hypothetical protein